MTTANVIRRHLPHFASGPVIKGFGRGSKELGIPTGNSYTLNPFLSTTNRKLQSKFSSRTSWQGRLLARYCVLQRMTRVRKYATQFFCSFLEFFIVHVENVLYLQQMIGTHCFSDWCLKYLSYSFQPIFRRVWSTICHKSFRPESTSAGPRLTMVQ